MRKNEYGFVYTSADHFLVACVLGNCETVQNITSIEEISFLTIRFAFRFSSYESIDGVFFFPINRQRIRSKILAKLFKSHIPSVCRPFVSKVHFSSF